MSDALAVIIAGINDPAERFAAEMLVSGAATLERAHPLTEKIATAKGESPEQVDVFFRSAAAL